MATLPEITIPIKLTGLAKLREQLSGLKDDVGKKLPSALIETSKGLNKISRELNAIARPLTTFGTAITGTFGVMFASARRELPEVDRQLKDLKNSFEEIAKSVSFAALPALKQAADGFRQFAGTVQFLVEQNQGLVQMALKLGALSLAAGVLTRAFSIMTRGLSGILALIGITKFTSWGPVITGILLVAAAFEKLAKSIEKLFNLNPPAWLAGLLRAGPLGLFAGITGQALPNVPLPNLPLKEISDNLGKISESFTRSFRSMQKAAEDFASTVGGALENALGDTVFDAITGRLRGLRSVLISFANDIGREFSRLSASVLLGTIFGQGNVAQGQVPQRGLLGGRVPFSGIIGKLLRGGQRPGRGGGAPSCGGGGAGGLADQFGALSANMARFSAAKDRAIGNLDLFSQALQNTGSSISEGGSQAAGALNTELTKTQDLTGKIQQGFQLIGIEIQKNTELFIKGGQDILKDALKNLAIAFAASAAVAIGLALIWTPAAIAASIATFGVAAKVGLNAFRSAMSQGIGVTVGSLGQATTSAGKITIGGGGVEGMQGGGVVRKPTLALVGEAGPEALIPLEKASQMGQTIININSDILFGDDPSTVDRLSRKLAEGLKRASTRRTGGTVISL